MSTLKVDGIRSNSASSDAITLASDGTCTAKITNRSNRNLIINGAMNVAQRGTSTTDEGYLVDRIELEQTNLNEAPTQAQVDVSSSSTPYSEGFRKAFKITNGNQTSADANDRFQVFLKQEAQNIANSGWNYTSSTSYITLQFWVKSSVAQNFYGYLRTKDGTGQIYRFETGSLTANTWTKVTKTIPGNSNITINNDNGEGLQITFALYYGADFTDSGASLNAWGAYASGTRTPDMTGTLDDWYLTNDATWELTGVQLEVGSVATDFEHRSYGQELELCKRYFYKWNKTGSSRYTYSGGYSSHATSAFVDVTFNPEMRAAPTVGSFSDANVTSASWSTLNPECAIYNGTATQAGSAARIASAVDFSAEL